MRWSAPSLFSHHRRLQIDPKGAKKEAELNQFLPTVFFTGLLLFEEAVGRKRAPGRVSAALPCFCLNFEVEKFALNPGDEVDFQVWAQHKLLQTSWRQWSANWHDTSSSGSESSAH